MRLANILNLYLVVKGLIDHHRHTLFWYIDLKCGQKEGCAAITVGALITLNTVSFFSYETDYKFLNH